MMIPSLPARLGLRAEPRGLILKRAPIIISISAEDMFKQKHSKTSSSHVKRKSGRFPRSFASQPNGFLPLSYCFMGIPRTKQSHVSVKVAAGYLGRRSTIAIGWKV
jgi:hypothetical protein